MFYCFSHLTITARTNLATTTQYTQYVIELAATLPVILPRARAQQTETSEVTEVCSSVQIS